MLCNVSDGFVSRWFDTRQTKTNVGLYTAITDFTSSKLSYTSEVDCDNSHNLFTPDVAEKNIKSKYEQSNNGALQRTLSNVSAKTAVTRTMQRTQVKQTPVYEELLQYYRSVAPQQRDHDIRFVHSYQKV